MSIPRLIRPEHLAVIRSELSKYRRTRSLVVMTVAFMALLSASVAIGQASLDFDLACRSVFTGGGGMMTGGFYGLHGALGLPIVPPKESELSPTYAVRSGEYGLRAGFLPGYPSAATANGASISVPDQAFVQRLPFINKLGRIVRGGC